VRLLVLWDLDQTLLSANGVGRRQYERALADMFGVQLPNSRRSFAGRTDRAIALEVLGLAGVPDPERELRPFLTLMSAQATQMADAIREHGRLLPGAAEALTAMAAARAGGEIIQSLLTGNIPEMARVKVTVLGLAEHVDLTIGAYGDASTVRADLVEVARRKAADRYGHDFRGRATILVGDTPNDIDAATATGASAVGVATGSFSVQELTSAGAHVVLPDLADTQVAVAAILGAAGN
jgi:phosphoglycolate phosphatase-like HAD superfamily hydrolase